MPTEEDLFGKALNLEEPWYVENVVFDTRKLQVDIYLAFRTGARFPCPECRALCEIHDTRERTWRHLNFFQYPAYIHANQPRVKCPQHGTKTTTPPWSRPKGRATTVFELFLLILCRETSVSAASIITGIHDDSAWRILHHHVSQARKRQDLTKLRKVGVDESSIRKGHNYLSVFCDIDRSRVVHVEEGKDSKVIGCFKNWLGEKDVDPRRVEEFCSDMSSAYVLGITESFPWAEITFDRYHVMAMVNKALDDVRRQERARNTVLRDVLKNTRYLWLKNPSSLTSKQRKRLDRIKNLDLRTARAWHIKTGLQRLWEIGDLEGYSQPS